LTRLYVALIALTVVTGMVDAASLLGMGHIFAANMTGNVVFLGFALAGAPGVSIARCATALAAFVGGAALGGRLMAVPPTGRTGRIVLAWTAEAILLAGAALLAFRASGEPVAPLTVLALAAIAMGIRNAGVRALGIADITTTVLTLTLTGLSADSRLAGGDSPRWQRRTASVVAMVAGAALGTLLLRRGLALTLLVSALVVGTAALSLGFARDQRSV